MKMILKNNFHNTETYVYCKNNKISKASYKAACRRLCGCNCECGGIRGPQSVEIIENENFVEIYPKNK